MKRGIKSFSIMPEPDKMLLAKAVEKQTPATFLRIVGLWLIHKYLGYRPKLIWELFQVGKEHSLSIVFIDEIDTIANKR